MSMQDDLVVGDQVELFFGKDWVGLEIAKEHQRRSIDAGLSSTLISRAWRRQLTYDSSLSEEGGGFSRNLFQTKICPVQRSNRQVRLETSHISKQNSPYCNKVQSVHWSFNSPSHRLRCQSWSHHNLKKSVTIVRGAGFPAPPAAHLRRLGLGLASAGARFRPCFIT